MSLPLLCRNVTTFSIDGGLDEDAFRQSLHRLVDAGHGVYLASGGSGEGHALTPAELTRVYEIGVEVCKGKVPVNANPPERHTARATIEETQRAVDAGVEVVNVYGPASSHGYKPTDPEFLAFYDDVLSAIKHTVAVAPHPVMGYSPKAALIAEVCRRHQNVIAVNLSGLDDAYCLELMRLLDGKIDIYVPINGADHMLELGAKGLVAAEANLIPKTFRLYLDAQANHQPHEQALRYADIIRLAEYVRPWQSSTPRWLKMAMKLLKLPGGQGGVREPYRMPAEDEQKKFLDGLLRLGIAEIDEMARAAGYSMA